MPQTLFPDVINNLNLFSGISHQEKLAFMREGRIRWCAKGQYLFRYGEPINHFYIVCSGLVQLLRQTPDGCLITTDFVIPGKTIGKNEIFHKFSNHRQLSAIATEDTIVVEFSAAWLKKIAAENSVIALNILSALSQYAYMVEVENEHKSTMTAAQQVACFLQRLCTMHDFDPQGFELPYSKTLIASRLGMEPETFSRALARLRGHGIEVKDMWVVFYDVEMMGNYVCNHCSIANECVSHNSLKHSRHCKEDADA